MKQILIIILVTVSYSAFAQKESGSSTKSDSIKSLISRELIPPITIKPDYFIPLRALNTYPTNLHYGIKSYETNFDNSYDLPINLLLPMQFQSHKGLKFIYTILGIAEIGAVGYLAYKHIQKYGFSK